MSKRQDRAPTRRLIGAAALIIGLVAATAGELEPDQIALVINSKVPESRELAEFYAKKRNIPDGRIIALDLPFPQEELAFERYDPEVVPPVRKFLSDHGLRQKVTCLVTFWGVPLRIGRRTLMPEEAKQLETVRLEAQKTQAELVEAVNQAEALAKEVTGTYQLGQGTELPQLAKRAGDAMTAAMRAIATTPEGDRRNGIVRRFLRLLGQVSGETEVMER